MNNYNKAWVALIMAIIIVVEDVTGWGSGITEEWVIATLAILTPILVWLVPNRY